MPDNRLCGCPREVPLIKFSSIGEDFLLGDWIPEQPGLVLSGVPNEEAFLSVGLQLLALVLLDMYIGSTAKDPKMQYIRLRTVSELMGHLVVL